MFCPTGRSSNILATLGPELRQLAATGAVSAQMMADTKNVTLMKLRSAGSRSIGTRCMILWFFGVLATIILTP